MPGLDYIIDQSQREKIFCSIFRYSEQKRRAKMNLSYSNKLNLQKQNNITFHLLGCDSEHHCLAGEDHCLAGELRQGGGDVGGECPS